MLGLGSSIITPSFVEGVTFTNTKSLSFDGTSDYLDTNYTANTLFQGSFSASMWVKPTDGQGTNQVLFGVELGTSDAFVVTKAALGTLAILHYSNNAGVSSFAAYTTDAARFADGTQSAFTHVVVTVTKNASGDTSYAIYDDGSAVAASYLGLFRVDDANHAAFDHGGLELNVGASNDDGTQDTFFGGLIDEVAFFTKALTAGEVSAIYNSGDPTDISSHANLLMYYRFEDDVTDTAGTSNGTNNGASFSSTVPSS